MTTLNLQVGASNQDAAEAHSTPTVSLTGYIPFGNWVGFSTYAGFYFSGVSGLSGSTIDTATLTFRAGFSDTGSFIGDWYAEDGATPSVFSAADSNISNRTLTTATCEGDSADFGNWSSGSDYTFTGDGVNTIAGIIQELADSYDPAAIVLIWVYSSGTGERVVASYDQSAATAPKLDIDYTAAAGITLTPDPATTALVAPSVTLDMGTKTLTPDPATVSLIAPIVTVKPPTKTLTPDPAIVDLVAPQPTVTVAINLTPGPATLALVVPSVVLEFGTKTLTPTPAAIALIAPTVTVTGIGATTVFATYMWTVSINPDEFPTGRLFYLVLQLYTTSAGTPAQARLYNVTDGLIVSGSEVSTAQTALAEAISSSFSLPSGSRLYRVEVGGLQGGEFYCEHAKVKAVSG